MFVLFIESDFMAHMLNYQSKQLLEIAKRGVEIAIEQDEDIATSWINQELKKIGVYFSKEFLQSKKNSHS